MAKLRKCAQPIQYPPRANYRLGGFLVSKYGVSCAPQFGAIVVGAGGRNDIKQRITLIFLRKKKENSLWSSL